MISLGNLCPMIHPVVDRVSSLTVVYSAGAVVVPKGNLRQRKDRSSTIERSMA